MNKFGKRIILALLLIGGIALSVITYKQHQENRKILASVSADERHHLEENYEKIIRLRENDIVFLNREMFVATRQRVDSTQLILVGPGPDSNPIKKEIEVEKTLSFVRKNKARVHLANEPGYAALMSWHIKQ